LSAALSRLDSLSASTAQQLDSLRAQHELSLATARQEMDELRSTLTALQNQRDNTISSSVSSDAHAVADSHLQMAEVLFQPIIKLTA
jgi:DNA anti-recombination protein RmuC